MPASAQRIWASGETAAAPVTPVDVPGGLTLRSIAPESVEPMSGSGGVIFAGQSTSETAVQGSETTAGKAADAPGDGVPESSPGAGAGDTNVSAPEKIAKEPVPQRQISAPDMKRAWLSTQLPAEVPRQDYSGWAYIRVDDKGKVTEAKITTSSGDLKVDKATLARLEREFLEPAVETLPDGTRVPVSYAGQWFFRWILLRSE